MKRTNEKWSYEQLFDPELNPKGDLAMARKELLLTPDFVPSDALREFWKKEAWGFGDEGIAAIICNSKAPYGRKFDALLKLGNMTDDADLKKSIGKCLYEEMDLHIRQVSITMN